jgi:hypothetical protein
MITLHKRPRESAMPPCRCDHGEIGAIQVRVSEFSDLSRLQTGLQLLVHLLVQACFLGLKLRDFIVLVTKCDACLRTNKSST